MSLTELAPRPSATKADASQAAQGDLPTDEAAWGLLPKTLRGGEGPVPNWAKAVARQLPRTAAAMVKLDYAQRTQSPLEPKLRAKMRWMVAQANRCDYAQQTALADLRRAGASDEEIAVLIGDPAAWPAAEQAPLRFARQHSLDAPRIPDALFEQLRQDYGDRRAAAMVLLGAYGNFQDRILLGLQLPLEANGPLAPLDVDFEPSAFEFAPILPPSRPASALRTDGQDLVEDAEGWGAVSYEELQSRLDRQRERVQRLPTPQWEEVAKQLPPEFTRRPTRIVWSLVCLGYVPELAVPWATTTRTMWAETQQDRILEESLFWVQTRAVECNYCMGHCEMLLEVAGLNRSEIDERLSKLASDDWSAFSDGEQRAYAYARKLSKTPWELTRDDYAQLERDYGEKAALATFFWLCRGLYMTRISDGFQLQLERDNVFADFAPKPAAK